MMYSSSQDESVSAQEFFDDLSMPQRLNWAAALLASYLADNSSIRDDDAVLAKNIGNWLHAFSNVMYTFPHDWYEYIEDNIEEELEKQ